MRPSTFPSGLITWPITFLMINCSNDGIAFPLVSSMITSEGVVEGAHVWPRFPVLACVSGVIQLVQSNKPSWGWVIQLVESKSNPSYPTFLPGFGFEAVSLSSLFLLRELLLDPPVPRSPDRADLWRAGGFSAVVGWDRSWAAEKWLNCSVDNTLFS